MNQHSWAEDLAREDTAHYEETVRAAEPAAAETALAEPDGDARQDAELARLRAEAEANLAGWQRAQADFINLKRRTEQELGQARSAAHADLMLQLLPALDDLDRALASAPDEVANTPWFGGLQMVHKKMLQVFERAGLEPLAAAGQTFDPNLHEAVATVTGAENTVVDVYQKGYRFKDRVLRPAMVTVGDGTSP